MHTNAAQIVESIKSSSNEIFFNTEVDESQTLLQHSNMNGCGILTFPDGSWYDGEYSGKFRQQ